MITPIVQYVVKQLLNVSAESIVSVATVAQSRGIIVAVGVVIATLNINCVGIVATMS